MRVLHTAASGLLALSFSTLAMTSADAAEWHRYTAASPTAGSAVTIADAHLAAHSRSLGLAGVQLERVSEMPTAGHTTVRYRQTHQGIVVLDSAAAVQVAPAGQVVATVLQVERNLSLAITPRLSAERARQRTAADYGRQANATHPPQLAVLPGPSGAQARLVWTVVMPTGDGGYRHIIDALSGRTLAQHSLARHVNGRVYPISSVVTPVTEDLELLDLLPSTPQLLTGGNGNFLVANYTSGTLQDGIMAEQTLEPSNPAGDFLYDPPTNMTDPTDAFAQVNLYYHITRYRNELSTNLGIDMSPASWKLTAVANITDDGTPVDNAFFSQQGIGGAVASPNFIGIGQGSQFDFSDDSDVFLHEMTHYLTHNAVGYNGGQTAATSWGLSPFGGSIDEGVSDYFACSINDDPILGEASLGLLGNARDLTDTSKKCPDDLITEVHADGELIGSFGWQLRTEFGKLIGDQLVWGAITLLMPNPSMGDFARGVQQTATDLQSQSVLTAADVETINGLIDARGLNECDEELPLREGEPRKGSMLGLNILAQAFGGGDCQSLKEFGVQLQSLFHYVVTPNADAIGLRIQADVNALGAGGLDWGIYGRLDEHVSFSAQGFLPVVNEFDYVQNGITSGTGDLVIDENSDPPFDPNATYHFVVVHQNCPFAQLEITATNLTEGSGAGGAGGAGGGGGAGGDDVVIIDEGCGCRVAASSDPARNAFGWLALTLGLGLAMRRRRRR